MGVVRYVPAGMTGSLVGELTAQGEPAQKGSGRVVGMAFDPGREREKL